MSDEIETKKTRRGSIVYRQNPFMTESHFQTKTKRVTKNSSGNMFLVSEDTGEVEASIAGFWESKEVDSTKFVKLYIAGVKAFAGLKNPGTKVFEVMYSRMLDAIGKDQIIMSFAAIDQKLHPMSEATYMRGMSELIEKGFLASSPVQSVYWTNPTYMFNGDTLSYVQKFRRAKAEPDNFQKKLEEKGQQRLFGDTTEHLQLEAPFGNIISDAGN